MVLGVQELREVGQGAILESEFSQISAFLSVGVLSRVLQQEQQLIHPAVISLKVNGLKIPIKTL